jgi:PadR family transcriptional regulator PadR
MDALVTANTALLRALTARPGYGLELITRVRARTNGVLDLTQGSVYPALRELESAGLVETVEVLAVRRGRSPLVYQLTAEGLQLAQKGRRMAAALTVCSRASPANP